MPKPIPPHKRDAILTDIRAEEKPRNQIARDHHVSVGTVSNIAKDAGLTGAFDRSNTKKATEAKRADHQARLVELASKAAWLAERALESFEAMSEEDWARQSLHARALTFGIAADKAKDLAPDDTSHDQVTSLFGALLSGLQAKHGDGDDSAAE